MTYSAREAPMANIILDAAYEQIPDSWGLIIGALMVVVLGGWLIVDWIRRNKNGKDSK
jgi:hypothetical protein